MFNADTIETASHSPSNADILLDDEYVDPAADDYMDRCLFEIRARIADFRNL
jgi:hypothetical protein